MTEHKSGPREGVEGVVEDVKGKAKEAAGTVFGKDSVREEGRAQQDKAESQREAAKKEAEAEKERAAASIDEQRQRAHQRGQD
ncbi:CsbD family protein [Nocardia sp. NPDC050712]|uniref:microaggregate-binding protein 1 n=1 Tax=Nocardia sp. NPDC050712 TaxID=3155518 RepID=UPI0033E23C27